MLILKLTPDELHTITHALDIAARQFTDDVRVCSLAKEEGLMAQFKRQADDTQALLEELEEMKW